MPAEEKTEDPTPKRRREAREEGQVAKSQDLSMAFTLLFSFILLYFLLNNMINEFSEYMTKFFSSYLQLTLSVRITHNLLVEAMKLGFDLVFPIMVVIAIVGSAAGILQVGFLFTPKVLQPKFSSMNPISGLGQIFSKDTVVELSKSLLKIGIIGSVAYLTIKNKLPKIILLSKIGLDQTLKLMGSIIYSLAMKISLVLIVLGIADFIYQKWDHEQELKMSKQEVKEERKQTEGNPEVQKRQEEKQQEIAMNRMMEDVPEADVVITNPTHIAIAIQFDIETMEAPLVVAKGKGDVAQRIREKAEEFEIEIVEEKPLARALYDKVEIGEEIPAELYQAVAEVLAYVYQLDDERRY